MTRTDPARAILALATLSLVVLGAGGCAPGGRTAGFPASDAEGPERLDLTATVISVPCAAHVVPDPAALRTFVPWDSVAVLTVLPPGETEAGALVVRYGKSVDADGGGAATLYLLERPGPVIEPIAIEWQPAGGAELRAIARVDGVLRRYDFDRR